MDQKSVKQFLKQSPAIRYTMIAKEAKVNRRTFRLWLSGETKNLQKSTISKLLPVLRKYGYND